MLACTSKYREMIWHESNLHFSAHKLFDAVHHGLHVPAYRIEVHRLMHLLAVPSCNLVFPVKLSFGESVLLKKVMSLHEDERSRSLESYATLDSDDGVSDVDVTSDSERASRITNSLDNFHRAHFHSVE